MSKTIRKSPNLAKKVFDHLIKHWWQYPFLILMSILTLYPVMWVLTIATSGKQSPALAELPENLDQLPFLERVWVQVEALIPQPQWNMSSFVDLFQQQPFLNWLWNSFIISAGTTVVGVFLACTAAYAFSRFRFPGRRAGLMVFLVSQMFPGTLMMVPLYIIVVQWLGLGNAYLGLILIYTTIALPFCVWMLKGYFDTIPIEIEESAIMDGASQLMIWPEISQ